MLAFAHPKLAQRLLQPQPRNAPGAYLLQRQELHNKLYSQRLLRHKYPYQK
jgi:hypothetical protein